MSDRIAVMHRGRIEQVGHAGGALRPARHAASSPTSSARPTCSRGRRALEAGRVGRRLDSRGRRRGSSPTGRRRRQPRCEISVRPESIAIGPRADGASGATPGPGRTGRLLGAAVQYHIRTEGGLVAVGTRSQRPGPRFRIRRARWPSRGPVRRLVLGGAPDGRDGGGAVMTESIRWLGDRPSSSALMRTWLEQAGLDARDFLDRVAAVGAAAALDASCSSRAGQPARARPRAAPASAAPAPRRRPLRAPPPRRPPVPEPEAELNRLQLARLHRRGRRSSRSRRSTRSRSTTTSSTTSTRPTTSSATTAAATTSPSRSASTSRRFIARRDAARSSTSR